MPLSRSLEFLGILAVSTCLLAHHSTDARAAEEVLLMADQSQVISLPEPPATLVIGNPSIADVTTDGRMLFFHPRGFGLTNVVALDGKGNKLGDYLVRVLHEDSYSVSMYSPDGRRTYTCRKDCEPTMRIGDADPFFSLYKSQAEGKNALAGTQAMGEEMLVPSTTSSSSTTTTMTAPPPP